MSPSGSISTTVTWIVMAVDGSFCIGAAVPLTAIANSGMPSVNDTFSFTPGAGLQRRRRQGSAPGLNSFTLPEGSSATGSGALLVAGATLAVAGAALASADGSGSTLVAVLDPRLHAATASAQTICPQVDLLTGETIQDLSSPTNVRD